MLEVLTQPTKPFFTMVCKETIHNIIGLIYKKSIELTQKYSIEPSNFLNQL